MPRSLTEAEVQSFRDELCHVATRLFAEKGFDGLTLRALAGELGCSPMTPYRYFENKADIFHAVRTDAFRRFGARVEDAARPHGDPLVRLRALFHAYVRFALDEPHAYRIMFQLEQPETPPSEEDKAVTASTWAPLHETLEQAVAEGLLVGSPEVLAHLCWVQVHGLVSLHLSGTLNFGPTLESLLEPAIELLLNGSTPRAPAREGNP